MTAQDTYTIEPCADGRFLAVNNRLGTHAYAKTPVEALKLAILATKEFGRSHGQ